MEKKIVYFLPSSFTVRICDVQEESRTSLKWEGSVNERKVQVDANIDDFTKYKT